MGQLTRVNDPNDPEAGSTGTTWVYVYDRGGNILSKTAYAFTTGAVGTPVRVYPYVYGDSNWKDKLTSFDGHAITYDAIGNPLTDGTWTYVWEAGRLLKSMSKVEDGNTITMEFAYNYAGLRTKKIKKVNGEVVETTEYLLNGKQVVGLKKGTDEMKFYYDAQGRVAEVDFNGTKYSYVHNLQGDVIGILDGSGNVICEYKYDAWGKPLGIVIGGIGEWNPFRYRGYVWDEETGLYYLQSRYYNHNINRFIGIDKEISHKPFILTSNTFLYCYNNSVKLLDKNGNEAELAAAWASSMWWLSFADGFLPIGDIIYWGGIAVVGTMATYEVIDSVEETSTISISTIDANSTNITNSRTISETKAKADEKNITKGKTNSYWEARLENKTVVLGTPLTIQEACLCVSQGHSVMCKDQKAALAIVYLNGYRNFAGPERHGDNGYYQHYHPTRNNTGSESVHIWFYDEGMQ